MGIKGKLLLIDLNSWFEGKVKGVEEKKSQVSFVLLYISEISFAFGNGSRFGKREWGSKGGNHTES